MTGTTVNAKNTKSTKTAAKTAIGLGHPLIAFVNFFVSFVSFVLIVVPVVLIV